MRICSSLQILWDAVTDLGNKLIKTTGTPSLDGPLTNKVYVDGKVSGSIADVTNQTLKTSSSPTFASLIVTNGVTVNLQVYDNIQAKNVDLTFTKGILTGCN